MASFTSTVPFPASPKQYEIPPDHPQVFPCLQQDCISQTFQTFALRREAEQPGAKHPSHINQASVAWFLCPGFGREQGQT